MADTPKDQDVKAGTDTPQPEVTAKAAKAAKKSKKAPKGGTALPTLKGDGAKAPKDHRTLSLSFAILGMVITCVVGLVIGFFVFGGQGVGSLSGVTSLQENQLDNAVGSYTYNGKTKAITARDALDAGTGVDSAKKEDGSYAMPSADSILSYARNEILNDEVEAKGIEVSDEEMSAYAKDNLGTDDYATLASQYGLSEDQVKKVVRESAGAKKLYDQIVGDTGTAPEAPTAPAEDAKDTPTAEYGKYIVNLLGDEWDSSKNTWAREDGPYYAALKDKSFTADSATYEDATTAYYVAYQAYSETAGNAQTKWTDYVNGLLAKASLRIDEIVS